LNQLQGREAVLTMKGPLLSLDWIYGLRSSASLDCDLQACFLVHFYLQILDWMTAIQIVALTRL